MATTLTTERQTIREGLRRFYGSFGEVAKRAGVSPSLVYKVLNGSRRNDDVLLVASIVLADYKKEEAERKALIKENLQAAAV